MVTLRHRRRPVSYGRARLRLDLRTFLRDGRVANVKILVTWAAYVSFVVGLWSWTDLPAAVAGFMVGLATGVMPMIVVAVFLAGGAGQRLRGLWAEEDFTVGLLRGCRRIWTVRHGVRFDRMDVDHVATCSAGVLAVETKHTGFWDERVRAAHVEQALRSASKVRSWLRSTDVGAAAVPVTPVLVVWGAAHAAIAPDGEWVDGVLVVSGPAGPSPLHRLAGGWDEPAARALDQRLGAFMARRDEYDRAHPRPVTAR